MKPKLKFIIFSTLFEIVLGTLLHFTYNWSNNNLLVGAFSAVNESTWEHLKLAFFPMLISTLIGLKYFKNEPKFLCARVIAILVSITFITIFFYTYNGAIGLSSALTNILSFIFAIVLGELFFYITLEHNFYCNETIAKFILVALILMFVLFTYCPPTIPLFKDPLSNTYGMQTK